jgi:hypothetical protein
VPPPAPQLLPPASRQNVIHTTFRFYLRAWIYLKPPAIIARQYVSDHQYPRSQQQLNKYNRKLPRTRHFIFKTNQKNITLVSNGATTERQTISKTTVEITRREKAGVGFGAG